MKDISNKQGANGYITFGNKLTIQWGRFSHTGSHGSDVTVTYPKAFTGTAYSLAVTVTAANGNEQWSNAMAHSKTATNFKFRKIFSESLSLVDYIAIGY